MFEATGLQASKIVPRIARKFEAGPIVVTRAVNDRLAEDGRFAAFIWKSLGRHLRGDWGDLGEEDKQENAFSLTRDLRLFSAYEANGYKVWIITEADRSVTTVLFPEDY